MLADGFPLGRRPPDANKDVLSGSDFLSILMDTSPRRRNTKTTLDPPHTTVVEIEDYIIQTGQPKNNERSSRSTLPFAQSATTEHLVDLSNKISDSSDSSNDGVILAVRISSSVGKTINKELHQAISSNNIEEITTDEITTLIPTTDITSRNFVLEDVPSIIAKSSKSELNVEESEPITKDNPIGYEEGYPAKVEPLPSQAHLSYDPTADFLNQGFSKSTKQPVHHTVIYHDHKDNPKGARSVSYSSIIQALPQLSVETEKPIQYERHERNYNGAQVSFVNNFNDNPERRKNDSRPYTLQSENKNVYPPKVSQVTESWQNSEKQQASQITTERNWETQEKAYVPPSPTPRLPKVYGRAEQNYEVDEAVSIETNGRAHGVQPSVPPRSEKKHDDNQKVGYVVEGRNYRKYRVEERTADGFIVGEYGVVSHDDGSLRGVRYTADGTINPRVISEALMKFLSL